VTNGDGKDKGKDEGKDRDKDEEKDKGREKGKEKREAEEFSRKGCRCLAKGRSMQGRIPAFISATGKPPTYNSASLSAVLADQLQPRPPPPSLCPPNLALSYVADPPPVQACASNGVIAAWNGVLLRSSSTLPSLFPRLQKDDNGDCRLLLAPKPQDDPGLSLFMQVQAWCPSIFGSTLQEFPSSEHHLTVLHGGGLGLGYGYG
jgi:hypothetical protein